MLGGIEKGLLALLLVVLMTGMGATLRVSDFTDVLERPRGALIGLFSQFGWMPAIAFGLAKGLDLPTELALGLVIVGATPGGTTSNMFTYFSRGDVALSISMTVVSTVVAVVAMPLVLFAYAGPLGGGEIAIPYGNIITTLLLVLVPVAAGMAIRARNAGAARRAEQLGAISGVVVLVLLVVSSAIRNRAVFAEIPTGGYIAAAALGLLGMTLGYLGAAIARLTRSQCRAVSLETGIQNSALAFGIILASFPPALQDAMLRLPMLYALFVLISATLVTFAFRATAEPAGGTAQARMAS
jgi:BASS family bile acid:Na+ symporter